MVFALFVIALALAPGLQAVQTRELQVQIQTLPALLAPEAVIPELRPEIIPEVIPELRPEIIPELRPEVPAANPCDSCFEYMTALIGQLTEGTAPEFIPGHPMPELPVYIPGVPNPQTPEDDDVISILPHPMPEVPVYIPGVPNPETPEDDDVPIFVPGLPNPQAPEAEAEVAIPREYLRF